MKFLKKEFMKKNLIDPDEIYYFLMELLLNATGDDKKVIDLLVDSYGMFMTVTEVAKTLTKSKKTIYRYYQENLLVGFKSGKNLLIYSPSVICPDW